MRAIYGAGRYELSISYKKFAVDSARWHSWFEKRHLSHVEAFRQYKPSLSDNFLKPKSAGRKPSYKIKQKSTTPEMSMTAFNPAVKNLNQSMHQILASQKCQTHR